MAEAVTAGQLQEALTACGVPDGAPLAIAVSGGPDSLALALLASELREIVCLTVDHGLRPGSEAEARGVANIMAARGVEHHILTWHGDKPTANLQAEARAVRYGLMADWCELHGVRYLLTAHHQDDQAETLLLRLARGSGVYGLAAMPSTSTLAGRDVMLVRPFLATPKASLVAYLKSVGQPYVDDPSNKMKQFDRVKIREFLTSPPLEGFSAERLAATAARLRRSRDALEFYEQQWLEAHARPDADGSVILDVAAFDGVPDEIVLRSIASCLRFVSGQAYVPRMEKLERAVAAMQSAEFSGQTLYGVQITKVADGRVLMFRELASVAGRMKVKDGAIWDNRFEISAGGDIAGLEIGALGLEGWTEAVKKWPELRDSGMPFAARLVLPAFFETGDICAIPHLQAEFGRKRDVSLSLKSFGWPKK